MNGVVNLELICQGVDCTRIRTAINGINVFMPSEGVFEKDQQKMKVAV